MGDAPAGAANRMLAASVESSRVVFMGTPSYVRNGIIEPIA
jgi:hypothetical protein